MTEQVRPLEEFTAITTADRVDRGLQTLVPVC